jgi:protease-4
MLSWLRSRRFWVIAVLVIAVLSIVLIPLTAGDGGGGGFGGSETIAVAHLEGPIQSGGGAGGLLGGVTLNPGRVEYVLDQARELGVGALVLRVDSPGGAVAASQEILAMVQSFREETETPVVVSMGDVAASGGYYISVGADRIVANEGTLTGSIGVVWEVLDLTGLYEKLGIQAHSVASGRHKEAFSLGKLTPESRAIIQTMSDQMHAEFIAAVAAGRGLTVETVRELATGQPFTGLQAKDLGLVDEVGGLETAVDVAMELAGVTDARVIEIEERSFGLFDTLYGFENVFLALRSKLAGPELAVLEGVLDERSAPRYCYGGAC